jgi:hypothetical protein
VTNQLVEFLRSGDNCPPIEEIVTLLDGVRGIASQRACEEHVAGCPRCSTELYMFREFRSAQPNSEERAAVAAITATLRKSSPAKPAAWWQIVWQPRILAPASIALAAMAIVVAIGVHGPTVPREPSAISRDVTRSLQVVPIGPLGDVRQVPHEFQWRSEPGMSRYRVRLLEIDSTEVWNTIVTGQTAVLPPEVASKITLQKRMLWEVASLDAAGQAVSSSGLQSFRVTR